MKTGTVFIRLLAKPYFPTISLTHNFTRDDGHLSVKNTALCYADAWEHLRKQHLQVQEAWPPAGVWGRAPRFSH